MAEMSRAARQHLSYIRLKWRVMALYGPNGWPCCSLCMDARLAHLTIDHVHGGGTQERKRVRGLAWYRELARQPRRPDLRVLCANCQLDALNWGFGGTNA